MHGCRRVCVAVCCMNCLVLFELSLCVLFDLCLCCVALCAHVCVCGLVGVAVRRNNTWAVITLHLPTSAGVGSEEEGDAVVHP